MVKNYEYALFSVECYNNPEDDVFLPEGRLPSDWSILLSSQDGGWSANGYFGRAYINNFTKQLIIAHAGTDNIFADVGDDIALALLDWQTQQFHENAIPFINAAKAEYFRVTGLGPREHLSYTGHSLGAFLAELSGAMDKVPVRNFESPGSRPNIQNLIIDGTFASDAMAWIDANTVTFNAAPNAVSTANTHVGKMYRVYSPYMTIDGMSDQPGNIYYGYSFSFTGQHRMIPIFQQFQPGQDLPTVYSEPDVWPFGTLVDTSGYNQYKNYDQNPYYWEKYIAARWAADPEWANINGVSISVQEHYGNNFAAYRSAFISEKLNRLPSPELQTGVTILTHGLSNAEIFGTTNKRDRVITTEGNYDIPDFGGSDRYENVRAVNKYKFLPDSVTADEDVIADENAPANQIFMGDRLFGTDAPTCVSEVSCTMVHDGRTFNLGMQGSDLVIQAQSSSHSVRVEEFENGDFGIDLSKRRVEIVGLRVDALVSLGDGGVDRSGYVYC